LLGLTKSVRCGEVFEEMAWLISRALMEAYANSPSSLVLVEAFSAGTCSDGELSAPSSTTPTPPLYSSSDKMMGFCCRSRCGMTCEPLTESLGADVLTWFLAGFRAKTFRQPARASESRGPGRDSGEKWQELWVKFDRDSHSWKTHRCLFQEDLAPSSLTLPRWGSMRNGALFQRKKPSFLEAIQRYITSAKESGSSQKAPMPNCIGYRSDGELMLLAKMTDPAEAEAMADRACKSKKDRWIKAPTPRANDAVKRGNFDPTNSRNGLAGFAKMPTPTARDHRSQNKNGRFADQLPNQVGGQLNPEWVEWLMGFPAGWTELKPLAMHKFRTAWLSHGQCFVKELSERIGKLTTS
jgi:hypothetical protein